MDTKSFDIDYRGVNVNIAQIQVLAAIVRDMVRGNFSEKNYYLLDPVPLPMAFIDWNALNEFCKVNKDMESFKILSDTFGISEYSCEAGDHSQPNSDVYLQLSVLQELFSKLEQLNLETASIGDIHTLTQDLVNSYMFLNNYIGVFFFDNVCKKGEFRWDLKLHPGKINLEWMRGLNGAGTFVACSENKKRFQKVFKARLDELACQCRFMAFWSCLLQIVTFPSLPKDTHDSFKKFTDCLLENFDSVFVHHIIVEQSDLNRNLKSKDRGAIDNTTRLKVYFTLEDGLPLLARFDLSHKGVPFLHINLENEDGEIDAYNHCELSLTEVEDNILKPLEEALMTFNYSGVKFKHTPTDFDKEMLHRVAVERALFSTSIVEWFTVIFSDIYKEQGKPSYDWYEEHMPNLSSELQTYVLEALSVLTDEVASYGFESHLLSHTEIFECVYDEIIRND